MKNRDIRSPEPVRAFPPCDTQNISIWPGSLFRLFIISFNDTSRIHTFGV